MRVGRGGRRGLAKRDVLIVLLLVLTAAGLFFTILPPAQEASARTLCAFHLKQIGEGIHRYHGRVKALPPSRIDAGYATWAVVIAPDVFHKAKERPLGGWDLQKSYADQVDAARRAQVAQYYCPARRNPPLDSNDPQQELPGALGDYASAAGDGNPKRPWDTAEADGALIPAEVLERQGGLILRWRSRTTFDSLRRGLGYTILLGDKHVPQGLWGRVAAGDGSLYNGAHPASFARVGGPGFGLAPSPQAPFNRNFGSAHPDGICQFLMADNSVQSFAPTVAGDVLGRLMTRDLPPGWGKEK
jgi:hypothetical protein